MDTDHCITVTHFINPHLFWYKAIGGPNEQFHVLSTFEQSLVELYKNKPPCDNSLRPQVGDKVAVNFIAWNKYIRAEILQKAELQQEEYIVWAIDYGFPLLTKKEHMRNLPSKLHGDIGHIQVGGIANVYPAEQEYDDMEGNLVMIKKDKWLQKTCNMLEKLLTDANSISFVKHFQSNDDHVWGELTILNHKGVEINARNYLLKTTNAIEENDLIFKETCSKFKTTKIAPWLSNDRNTKMKFNNIKHNYIEHSKQMSAIMVDENAKRKVEDWQERNERKKIEAVSELFESSCEISEDIIDDIAFDDSVSVANNQQPINYIGKAGMLTKIKQQKYATANDLPPSALPKAFEIDNMMFNLNWPSEPQPPPTQPSYSGSRSGSTNVSSRLQKLAQFTAATREEKLNSTPACSQPRPLIDLDSSASSTVSSVKLRQQKLIEMRRKAARAEKENKLNETSSVSRHKNFIETTQSSISQPKTSESYSYQLLEQSLTQTTSNNTTTDNLQDNKSEISVKNIRAKKLIEMRKKFGSSSYASSNEGSQINTPIATQLSTNNVQSSSKIKQEEDISLFKNFDFQLKPKIIAKPEDRTMDLNETYSLATTSTNTTKDKLKSFQSGYDSLTMIPAGYDITRLQNYKDEENHWHRKKSTRYDCVPHEKTSSTDELLSNNTNDQSFSSSDFFQMKTPKRINKTFTDTNADELDSQIKRCSQQHRDELLNEEFLHKGIKGDNYLSSEVSTSTNSTVPSQKLRKRRQLKSPTSQLSKIDKILQEHNIEKEMGNKNILDLKLLNTSSSSQKSLLTSISSNVSSTNDRNIVPIENKVFTNNVSSRSSSSLDKIRKEKVYKEVFNYEALMDIKHSANLPIIEGERKIQTKFIDHLVLAHSSIQLTPIEHITEAPFLPEIHEEMRQMRVNKVYRIQVYAWSHCLRGNSLFIVNPSRSGKTWSYLPPLCSLLCCRADLVKSSYGPVAIILVASMKHVEMVNNYCRRLMSGLKNEAPSCIPSYGMRNLIETKIQLLNGCGIHVATPSSILRLLHENSNEPLFDAERLQHIVIDDMDIMLSRSQDDFQNACRIIFKMAKKSKYEKLTPQLIVTSRDWDRPMVKLIRKSNQPLLLIGDFLEAAVYGQATLSVKLKSSAEKNDTILKYIRKMSETAQDIDNRTLIMCNDDEDVESVMKFLLDCGQHCIGYYSRSTEIERVTIDEWKKKISSQILVCTDARFCELKIQNVNNLIHYSMPTSWTQFTTRFSALARTYNNYVSQNFEQISVATSTYETNKQHCAHSMILLDENNSLQLPRLVDFMRKHNQTVHDEILAVSKRVLIMREEQRIFKGSILCPQLLEFGECDEARCNCRHELTRFDVISKSDGIPCSGEIRIHVLKVFSPTYYAVRLLHHKLPDTTKWVEVRRSSEALTFSIQLNMHYRNDRNLFLHWPPHINDLCIYQYAENFRRARILEAPIFDQKSTNVVQANLKVTLRLIDDGTIISSVKCNEIFVCDDKFKEFPPQAVDVRLMNIVPFDNERTWDSKTTKQVQKWIMEDIKTNYVVQASIDFALAQTIWVKNVVVMEKLTGIDAYCQVVHLKKSLVGKNFGVLYNGERKHVRDVAEEFGLLNVPTIDEIDNCDSDLDFQSCKNDESVNLIKFSSSNEDEAATNSSMESAETGLEPIKKTKHKLENNVGYTKENVINIDDDCWDNQLESGCEREEVYVPLSSKTLSKAIKQNEVNNIESDVTIPPPKTETWSQLPFNEIIKVEIGDEGENGNWENIFLQIIDKNSMFLFDELNKVINKHVENIKLHSDKQNEMYDFKPLHNCIVKYNNLYVRAKLYGVFGEKKEQRLYRFFLCDYACFTNAKTEVLYNDFLYETSEEIVTFTPYQAIHCTLAGIKWDRFNKRYQVTKDYLYACAVLENEKKTSNLQNLPINSYKILLYECDKENEFKTALLFNKTLVDNGITVYDEETKNFLEYEIAIDDKTEEIEEIVDAAKNYKNDEVLTFEQLMDFIKTDAFDIELDDMMEDIQKSSTNNNSNNFVEITKQNQKQLSIKSDEKASNQDLKQKIKLPSADDSEIDEQGHCSSSSFSNSSIKSSVSLSSTESSNCCQEQAKTLDAVPPPLTALNKRPLTTWYENDCMIFISIHAPDIKDYLLEVSAKNILFVAEIQTEKHVLNLNLLGSIEPQSVSHEIKGLNVVIRLKKIVYEKWPRLLRESIKYSWLKYNFNAFDSIEMEYIMPQQRLHTILDNELNFEAQQIDNYSSDEDSERELYQTYNPIADNDDDCDPFSAL